MKTILKITLLLFIGISSSCVLFMEYGSGNLVTQQYKFTDFNSVSITHTGNLTITQGDDYFVEVTCDDNIMEKLIAQQSSTEVLVTLPAMSMFTNYTLNINITMPEIKKIDASGASRVGLSEYSGASDMEFNLSGASSGTLNISSPANLSGVISGASRLTLNGNVNSLIANVSGASTLVANGESISTTITVSGASEFNGAVYYTDKVTANISGASKASINAKEAVGNVSGDSKLTLYGVEKDNVIYSY